MATKRPTPKNAKIKKKKKSLNLKIYDRDGQQSLAA